MQRISFSLCLLLAACTGAPNTPTTAEVATPAMTGDQAVAALAADWDRVLDETAFDDRWLQAFDDAELEKIVAEALRHNRELAAVSANLASAEEFALQAGAALLPAIAVGEFADHPQPALIDGGAFGAARRLQWELDVWARLSPASPASGDTAGAVRSEFEAARLSLVAQTAKAWLLANETNLQLALSQQAVDFRQQRLRLIETRIDSGAATAREAIVARAELEAARERQRLAIGALVQALRSIAAILGRVPAAELTVVREYAAEPAAIPAGIAAALLERRADLVAAEARVAAAFHRPPTSRATRLPRLSLTTADGLASSELTRMIGTGKAAFTPDISFLAPLDSDDRSASQLTIETAQQHAALENYRVIARRAFADVATALDNETRLQRRAQSLAGSLDDITARQAAASAGEGARDLLAELNLQARALDLRIMLTRTQYARLAQRVDLHLALGGAFGY